VDTIEAIVRSINRELVPSFEEKLRTALVDCDRDWLIDQIVRLTLDAHSLQEMDRRSVVEAKTRARTDRHERVRDLALDRARLQTFLADYAAVDREGLVTSGHLASDAPVKGTTLLTTDHRSAVGEELLTQAKDVLFALLFGDASNGTNLERVQQSCSRWRCPAPRHPRSTSCRRRPS